MSFLYFVLVDQPTSTITPTISVILSVFLTLLLTGGMLASFYYYRKKTHHRITEMTWEMNTLYESEDCDHNADEESILPSWLRVRPEMIYPQSCIEKCQQLGQGQFGSVFKGKLIQGKAVYVN